MKWLFILCSILCFSVVSVKATIKTVIEGEEDSSVLEEDGAILLHTNLNTNQQGWYYGDYIRLADATSYRRQFLVTSIQELKNGISFATTQMESTRIKDINIHKVIHINEHTYYVIGEIIDENQSFAFVEYFYQHQLHWKYESTKKNTRFVDGVIHQNVLLLVGEKEIGGTIQHVWVVEMSLFGQIIKEKEIIGERDGYAHSISITNNTIYIVTSSRSILHHYQGTKQFNAIHLFLLDAKTWQIKEHSSYRNEGHVVYYNSVHSDNAIYIFMRFENRGPFIASCRSLSFDGVLQITKDEELPVLYSFAENEVPSSAKMDIDMDKLFFQFMESNKKIKTIVLGDSFRIREDSEYILPFTQSIIVDYLLINYSTQDWLLLVEELTSTKRYVMFSKEMESNLFKSTKKTEMDVSTIWFYQKSNTNIQSVFATKKIGEQTQISCFSLHHIKIVEKHVENHLMERVSYDVLWNNSLILLSSDESRAPAIYGLYSIKQWYANDNIQCLLPTTWLIKPKINLTHQQTYDIGMHLETNAQTRINGVNVELPYYFHQVGDYIVELIGYGDIRLSYHVRIESLQMTEIGIPVDFSLLRIQLEENNPLIKTPLQIGVLFLGPYPKNEPPKITYGIVGMLLGTIGSFGLTIRKQRNKNGNPTKTSIH